jgi:hypothetical protein
VSQINLTAAECAAEADALTAEANDPRVRFLFGTDGVADRLRDAGWYRWLSRDMTR